MSPPPPSNKSSSSPELAVALGVGIGLVAGSLLARFYYTSSKRKDVASSATNAIVAAFQKNRAYKPGQTPTLPSPSFGSKVHVYDPSKLKSAYSLMISTVTPRPIALVSSRHGETKIDNVSPFSYFGAVAHDPPMLAIGFCRNRGQARKDSITNLISNNGQFCVNIISEWYLDAANHSCGNWDSSVDEFETSGMTKVNDCEVVDAPRVKEAAVSYECELEYVHTVTTTDDGDDSGDKKKETTDVVLAKVVRVHVMDDVLADDSDPARPSVNTMKMKPVGRLGGNIYCGIGDTVDIPRPKV
mmetsp:Transcript_2110/g.5226  ORF Transcript_2110/g.5226 Transcript_2110/m.5226 type:complete len:300 (+) Transcript_2110:3341-4240(+)